MTESAKNVFLLNWSRFQQRQEKKFTTKFNKALKIQLDAFFKSKDPNALPSYPLYTVLNDLYYSVGPEWARVIKSTFSKSSGSMGFNPYIAALMRSYYSTDLLNNAELMTSYSRQIIVDVLNKASTEGWSFDRIANELVKHPEFNKMRAMRIARTETVAAANGAALIYAQDSGLNMNKIWIAVKDRRTRHSHENVSTAPIPMNDEFKVGSAYMMHPGAKYQNNGFAVPAFELVNCRCTMAFLPNRSKINS